MKRIFKVRKISKAFIFNQRRSYHDKDSNVLPLYCETHNNDIMDELYNDDLHHYVRVSNKRIDKDFPSGRESFFSECSYKELKNKIHCCATDKLIVSAHQITTCNMSKSLKILLKKFDHIPVVYRYYQTCIFDNKYCAGLLFTHTEDPIMFVQNTKLDHYSEKIDYIIFKFDMGKYALTDTYKQFGYGIFK